MVICEMLEVLFGSARVAMAVSGHGIFTVLVVVFDLMLVFESGLWEEQPLGGLCCHGFAHRYAVQDDHVSF
eukprot:6194619-Pleurochrysis_carterae.AAC.1